MHTRLAGSMLGSHLTLPCFMCPLPCPAPLSSSSLQQPLHSCYFTHIASCVCLGLHFPVTAFLQCVLILGCCDRLHRLLGTQVSVKAALPWAAHLPIQHPWRASSWDRSSAGLWALGRDGVGLSPLCRILIQFSLSSLWVPHHLPARCPHIQASLVSCLYQEPSHLAAR